MARGKKAKRMPRAEGRREFLKLAGAGSVAAGAALLGGQSVSGSAAVADAREAGKGYRETEHVKTYYELARF